MIGVRIPCTLPLGHEDNNVPTFWLLLYEGFYGGFHKGSIGCRVSVRTRAKAFLLSKRVFGLNMGALILPPAWLGRTYNAGSVVWLTTRQLYTQAIFGNYRHCPASLYSAKLASRPSSFGHHAQLNKTALSPTICFRALHAFWASRARSGDSGG